MILMENILEENSDINVEVNNSENHIILNALSKIDNIQSYKNQEYDELMIEIDKKKRSRLEKAEEKIISKIYEKFEVSKEIDLNSPIDLVYTYVNYNDLEYLSKKENEIKKRNYLKTMKLNMDAMEIMDRHLREVKEDYNDFFVNLEVTRKKFAFIRGIIIIKPTPIKLNEVYHNDDNIFIINSNEFRGNIFFRPNNLIFFLGKLKFLSDVFLFGTQDCIFCGNINKKNLLKNGVVKMCLEKRTLIEKNIPNNGLRYLEEYNSNKLFEEKFNIFPKLVCMNQINVIRKDALQMMCKLFDYADNVDYLLLQYLTGYFFNLYEIDLELKGKRSGFYAYNERKPLERFELLKNGDVTNFCINYLNRKYLHYYVYATFINMGLLANKKVKNVYFSGFGLKSVYILPSVERVLREYGVKGKIWNGQKGKIGEDLLVSVGKVEEDVDMILLEINESSIGKVIGEIMYFGNIGKLEDECSRVKDVIFPKKFIRKMELKMGVPYTEIFPYCEFDEETTGVKSGKIKFNPKLKK